MDSLLKPGKMEVTFLVSDVEWEGSSEYLRQPQDRADSRLIGSTLNAELEIDLGVALALFLRRVERGVGPPTRFLELLTRGTPMCAFNGEVKEVNTRTYPPDDPHYGGLKEVSILLQCGLPIPLAGLTPVRFAPFEQGEVLEGISVLKANLIRPRSSFGITHKVKVVKVSTLRPHGDRHPGNFRLVTGTL